MAGGQVLFPDKIGSLSFSSPNVIMAATTSSPVYLTIGGQQYPVTSQLSVNAGSLTLQNLYFVYAVQSAGTVSLVVSTNVNSVGPSGYTSWKLVGAFYTDGSAAFSGFVAKTGDTTSTITTLLSGSGTYTTPKYANALRIRMVGGGGGGAGSGTTASTGQTSGGTTTFGTSLLTTNGGSAGATGGGSGGTAGGTATIGSPAFGTAITGQGGGGNTTTNNTGLAMTGYQGANSALGGGGSAGAFNGNGGAAAVNSGSGGGGAGSNQLNGGSIGGSGAAGGYIDAMIINPSASYSYTIGTGGTGGTGGASGTNGGAGGSGVIIIEEIKPNLETLKDL